MSEKIEVVGPLLTSGLQLASATGRELYPWWKKINPLWWPLNSGEPNPPLDYKVGSTEWWRQIAWFLRNPFQNLGQVCFPYPSLVLAAIIIALHYWKGISPWWLLLCPLVAGGVMDRNYTIVGTPPVLVTTLDDLSPPQYGWKWSVIRLGLLRLPFVSYNGKYVLFYAGWQWWGYFGVKLNLRLGLGQGF